jgi:hypothetical protein
MIKPLFGVVCVIAFWAAVGYVVDRLLKRHFTSARPDFSGFVERAVKRAERPRPDWFDRAWRWLWEVSMTIVICGFIGWMLFAHTLITILVAIVVILLLILAELKQRSQ